MKTGQKTKLCRNGGEGSLNRNKGFTLIELIVVIAIMGILAGLVGLSVSNLSSVNARKAASSVNMLISKCRMGCMSREGAVYMTLSLNDGNIVCNYYEKGTLVSTDTFSGKSADVTYTTKNASGTETTTPLEGNTLTLSFDRATGAQKAQAGLYCTRIQFAGVRTYAIVLYPETGSHELI